MYQDPRIREHICYAQQKPKPNAKKVIDLGDMEVHGELRRPNLFMVESNKRLGATVSKAAARKWKMFESSLLDKDLDPRVTELIKETPNP